MRGIQAEIHIIEVLALGAAARGHFAARHAQHVIARRTGPFRVHAGEALGEIPLHRIALAAERRLLLRVARLAPQLEVAFRELGDGPHGVLRLRILRQDLVVRLLRVGPARLAEGGVRGLELHLTHVVDLRGRDVGLHLLVERRLHELANRLGKFAGGGGPGRFRIFHEHVDRVVERAGAVALVALLHAKEQIRDLRLVGLLLLRLLLGLLPEHLREQIAAARHR